jgi:replicative DNA helicase
MDEILHKLPPQAIEVEESVLAFCLLNNQSSVIESLDPEDFYKTAHSIIFKSMVSLYAQSEPIDLASLANHLRQSDNLDKIGGAAYLARLIDACPVSTSINHHIKIIKDKAILRRLIAVSNETANECFCDNGCVESILDNAQKRTLAIDFKDDRDAVVVGDVLSDVIDKMETMATSGPTGIQTGISRIDLLLGGFQPGNSVVLAGRPSMGKTTLALNFLHNISILNHIPSVFFSLEMAKEQLVQRLISIDGRVDGGRFLTNSFHRDDWDRITDAAGRISDSPLYIDDRAGLSYMEVRRSMRKLVKKHDIKIAVIDYLTLMTGDKEEGRTREIGSISRAIKGMAKEFSIPIIVICQLSRTCEQRQDKRPLLSDLRDSGEIEQDADVVMFVYRDEIYNPKSDKKGTAEIIIRKHRNGGLGTSTMTFLKAYQRFETLAYPDQYGDYT